MQALSAPHYTSVVPTRGTPAPVLPDATKRPLRCSTRPNRVQRVDTIVQDSAFSDPEPILAIVQRPQTPRRCAHDSSPRWYCPLDIHGPSAPSVWKPTASRGPRPITEAFLVRQVQQNHLPSLDRRNCPSEAIAGDEARDRESPISLRASGSRKWLRAARDSQRLHRQTAPAPSRSARQSVRYTAAPLSPHARTLVPPVPPVLASDLSPAPVVDP